MTCGASVIFNLEVAGFFFCLPQTRMIVSVCIVYVLALFSSHVPHRFALLLPQPPPLSPHDTEAPVRTESAGTENEEESENEGTASYESQEEDVDFNELADLAADLVGVRIPATLLVLCTEIEITLRTTTIPDDKQKSLFSLFHNPIQIRC